jgi:glycosyltransferase involved in cell wall biosynthesis
MRIGALWQHNSAANYRVLSPLAMLGHRGHEILLPPEDGMLPSNRLVSCDAVLIYRRHDAQTYETIRRLKKAGVAVIWDVDDDFLHAPQSRRLRRETGGKNNRQLFAAVLKAAQLAHVVTTTTETLAEALRTAGVSDVVAIDNYVPVDPRAPRRSGGLTVGWIAGLEHRADAISLKIPQTLQRLQDRHPDLEVTCVGVDLGLRQRYRHAPFVPFPRLTEVMADFDIGIAPLTDTQFNRSRSSIKVKEYAASGVPWLASRVTPYADLGEHQGGRLVDDDGWFDALHELTQDGSARERLGKAGTVWARQQSIEFAVDRYEALFGDAVERVTGRRPATLIRPAKETLIEDRLHSNARLAVRIPRAMVRQRRA